MNSKKLSALIKVGAASCAVYQLTQKDNGNKLKMQILFNTIPSSIA